MQLPKVRKNTFYTRPLADLSTNDRCKEMADTHEITVFIWKNAGDFNRLIEGVRVEGEWETGHAAMKIQDLGAGKGDYYYFSAWPIESKGGHMLAARYGPNSMDVLKLQKLAYFKENKKPAGFVDVKLFATSNAYQTDQGIKKDTKANVKYRMTGPDKAKILLECNRIANNNIPFNIKRKNCSTFLAQILKAGGAPDLDIYERYTDKWTPNRLGKWCAALVGHYGGETK